MLLQDGGSAVNLLSLINQKSLQNRNFTKTVLQLMINEGPMKHQTR